MATNSNKSEGTALQQQLIEMSLDEFTKKTNAVDVVKREFTRRHPGEFISSNSLNDAIKKLHRNLERHSYRNVVRKLEIIPLRSINNTTIAHNDTIQQTSLYIFPSLAARKEKPANERPPMPSTSKEVVQSVQAVNDATTSSQADELAKRKKFQLAISKMTFEEFQEKTNVSHVAKFGKEGFFANRPLSSPLSRYSYINNVEKIFLRAQNPMNYNNWVTPLDELTWKEDNTITVVNVLNLDNIAECVEVKWIYFGQ